jgi:hypothetical protein
MDFIWLPAFKVLGTKFCLTEIFLSQCCNKIPSMDEQSHENLDKFMHCKEQNVNTDTDLLLELRLA